MTLVRYALDKGPRPAAYQLEWLRRGCCPYLAEASFFLQGESIQVAVETAGLFHLKTYLECGDERSGSPRLGRGMVPDVLRWLRLLTEAVDGLEEYLIFEEDVSLELSDLCFESRDGRPRLLLKPSGKDLLESLCCLCLEIERLCPGGNADLVERRLRQRNAEQRMDRAALLSFLSAWECETRA